MIYEYDIYQLVSIAIYMLKSEKVKMTVTILRSTKIMEMNVPNAESP